MAKPQPAARPQSAEVAIGSMVHQGFQDATIGPASAAITRAEGSVIRLPQLAGPEAVLSTIVVADGFRARIILLGELGNR